MSRTTSDPFTIGNVVSAGVRLYRDRFGGYFGIAFIATLWWSIPWLLFNLTMRWLAASEAGALTYTIVFVVGIIVLIFGFTKSLANTALISRLAFGHLTNQPEAISEARQNVIPRMWRFFWTTIFVIISILVINIVAIFVLIILGAIISSILPDIEILTGLQVLIFNILYILINLWLYSHFFIPEVPLAIERNISSIRAISRSWSLATGSVWRIQGIILVTALVTIPLYLIAISPIVFALAQLIGGLLTGGLGVSGIVPFIISAGASLLAANLLLGLINILVVPLWQSIKAVIYYDLRNRREGLDLELRK